METVVQAALRLWDRLPPIFCKSIILIQLKSVVFIGFSKYVILKGLDLHQTRAEWAAFTRMRRRMIFGALNAPGGKKKRQLSPDQVGSNLPHST